MTRLLLAACVAVFLAGALQAAPPGDDQPTQRQIAPTVTPAPPGASETPQKPTDKPKPPEKPDKPPIEPIRPPIEWLPPPPLPCWPPPGVRVFVGWRPVQVQVRVRNIVEVEVFEDDCCVVRERRGLLGRLRNRDRGGILVRILGRD